MIFDCFYSPAHSKLLPISINTDRRQYHFKTPIVSVTAISVTVSPTMAREYMWEIVSSVAVVGIVVNSAMLCLLLRYDKLRDISIGNLLVMGRFANLKYHSNFRRFQ